MPKYCLLFLYAFIIHCSSNAQRLAISNGRRTIKILPGASMELRTYNDSIGFYSKHTGISFRVYNISTDSIVLRRPTTWKDTFSYKFNAFNGKDDTAKKKYYKEASAYEYQAYAISGINKIRYRYQRDQSGEGGLGAIFVPGLNIYYIWSKCWRTRVFNMQKWKFVQ